MTKLIVVCIFSLVIITSFAFGFWLRGRCLGVANKFITDKPLQVQLSPNKTGKIPEGAILYKFRDLPEISTYYIFINLKDEDILRPYAGEDKFNLVAPLDAYRAQN